MDSSQKGGYIMANKKSKLGMISAVAAGTGTAIYLAQKAKNKSEIKNKNTKRQKFKVTINKNHNFKCGKCFAINVNRIISILNQ